MRGLPRCRAMTDAAEPIPSYVLDVLRQIQGAVNQIVESAVAASSSSATATGTTTVTATIDTSWNVDAKAFRRARAWALERRKALGAAAVAVGYAIWEDPEKINAILDLGEKLGIIIG